MSIRVIELDRRGGLIAQTLAAIRAEEAPRTGLHVSTIIHDIQTTLKPNTFKRGRFALRTMLFFQAMGNILEDVLAVALASRIRGWEKPEPRTYYGITGSPDGWSPRLRAIHEIKVTWVSEHNFLTSWKFDVYLFQAMFYALLWDADRIYLHVLFVCGDYRPAFPNAHTWIIKFNDDDKLDNFRRLGQHAVDIGLLDATLFQHGCDAATPF